MNNVTFYGVICHVTLNRSLTSTRTNSSDWLTLAYLEPLMTLDTDSLLDPSGSIRTIS